MQRNTSGLLAFLVCVAFFSFDFSNTQMKAQEEVLPKGGPFEEPEPLGQHENPEEFSLELELEGSALFTKVKLIGNQDQEFRFLIDSGATNTVLGKHVAEKLEIESLETPLPVQGVGTQNAEMAFGLEIQAGEYHWTAPLVILLDLSHIADVSGKWIDGILGADWLLNFKEIEFDFQTQKASFKEFEADQKKQTLNGMIAQMVGGLGEEMKGFLDVFKGLRKNLEDLGLPGFDLEDLKDFPLFPEKGEREEDFSFGMPQNFDSFKAQEGENPLPAFSSEPKLSTWNHPTRGIREEKSQMIQSSQRPQEPLELDFKMLELNNPLLGQDIVLVPLWFVEAEIEGKKEDFLFDTGASMLWVLEKGFAQELELEGIFDFSVYGVGKGEASMAKIQGFRLGTLEEKDEKPATIIELPEAFQQFETLAENPLLKLFNLSLPTPRGLMGLPLALRYRSMKVDFEAMKLHFEPYAEDQVPTENPFQEEAFILGALDNVLAGKAAGLGFSARTIEIDAWETYGLKDGGIMVTQIEAGGNAERAGLQVGDIIYAFVDMDLPQSERKQEAFRDMTGAALYAAYQGTGATWQLKIQKNDGQKQDLLFVLEEPLRSSK